MDERSKIQQSSWSLWPPRKWIALIVCGLVLGEASWLVIVSLTRDVLLPLMAMAMGGDNSSPLSLGKPEFNWPDLFTAVLQLCLAGLVAIVLNAWIQKRPKPGKAKSLSFNQAIPQTAPAALKTPAAAHASGPTAAQPRATDASPSATPVTPNSTGAPAAFKSAQPMPVAPPKPTAPAPPAAVPNAVPPRPTPKKPQEVYYNIVGERITPLDDETTDE